MIYPVIILDAGHGIETPGKCSPKEGAHHEWAWCRSMAARIAAGLRAEGYTVEILVPEAHDVSLRERCRRADAIYADARKNACVDKADKPAALLISLHNNAAGNDGGWHTARGFCAFVARKASAHSCRLARLLSAEAHSLGLGGNRATAPEGFLRADFAIIKNTRCPAVLTENLFMDNREDLCILSSEQGCRTIADVHIRAIMKFCKEL